MDSFYDAPRRPQFLPPKEKLVSKPVVPEISVLAPSNGHINKFIPHDEWRTQQKQLTNQRFPTQNKENLNGQFRSTQNTSYLKKQVRFESPVLQSKDCLSYQHFTSTKILEPPEKVKNDKCKPLDFQQMYMANIPNRHLDLSVIEIPKKSPECNVQIVKQVEKKSSETPKTYREFLATQTTSSIPKQNNERFSHEKTDNFPENNTNDKFNNSNFTRLPTYPNHFNYLPDKPFNNYKTDNIRRDNFSNPETYVKKEITTQTSQILCHPEPTLQRRDSDEPTVKDLLKIISQQNEQLLLLQKQVANLIARDTQPQIQHHNRKEIEHHDKYLTSTQHEQYKNLTPRKRGLPKFSIDLMTSFEVSFRPQQHKKDFANHHEPKIQELTENDTCQRNKDEKTVVDASLYLQEPVEVRETCPSPEPSIRINMNDYDDSDDDEFSSTEFGATFYKNLMCQINKMLGNSERTQEYDTGCTKNANTFNMGLVKEATLKHLRSIGINVPQFEESPDSSEDYCKNYSPSEVSFAVKQLLMKYLPDEHLAKITCKRKQSDDVVSREKKGAIPLRPEFSFATVQYMKKYNLIATNKDAQTKNTTPGSPKILDISTLKQQPKLL